ncbi:hypothetical protein EOD43_12915 [Sphingomonas crocodyli]|uniref:Uncharacterized protein n=1 Tax=Sphingomonas crocodyli TaxID=1979270 RepID=A0A437MC21_9SPHN|nr:hypothetical protein EOD43_12915 [Sphingomonas crocodyli]
MPRAAAEAAEIRRRRLRLLTLGEILAVAALVISGLTFWNSYEERRHAEADKVASSTKESRTARTLVLSGKADKDGDRLTLTALGGQSIQGQTIAFPAALDLSPIDSSDPRIERRWIESALVDALKAAGEKTKAGGDARLPVAITTHFYVDDTLVDDVALYDVGYTTSSSFLGGTDVKLKGLSLIGHTTAAAAQKRIDATWSARHKAPAK